MEIVKMRTMDGVDRLFIVEMYEGGGVAITICDPTNNPFMDSPLFGIWWAGEYVEK